ncbi:teichuronic acid biosynthesis protein TuaH [Mesobacillus campisalis]|uniref:teichuronic acid biosynthesis protein TuaH n=1 Tax=Mesobacillus campisalis TaxID=1408103 RepID=UPI0007E395D4|nr:glycosyltransferase [Mesobacillus campisalis]
MRKIHVIVATGDWEQDGLRYRRHRLAEHLQKQADTGEVIWLCPSPQITEDMYSSLPNGIWQFTVTDLFPHRLFRFGRYVDLFYQSKLHALLSYLKSVAGKYQVYLWYTFPGFPLLADLFPWDKIIYDCSDLWSSPINGKHTLLSTAREKVIANAENRIMDRANLIFCTSGYLREKVIERTGKDGHVYTFENGVDYNLFAGQREKKEGILPPGFKGTVLGFIGGIKPKLDFSLITKVARKKPDWLLLLVGPDGTGGSPEFRQLLEEKNVVWTGGVPSNEVPSYMSLIDIGIMPYKDSPYNQAVFPLKLFEFLGAGKPVAGVHLPSTKMYVEDGIYLHLESGGAGEFIAACEKLAEGNNNPVDVQRRRKSAQKKDWDVVFSGMRLACEGLPSGTAWKDTAVESGTVNSTVHGLNPVLKKTSEYQGGKELS